MSLHNVRINGTVQPLFFNLGSGVSDSQGNEIFENDIIQITEDKYGIIRYDHEHGKFELAGKPLELYLNFNYELVVVGLVHFDISSQPVAQIHDDYIFLDAFYLDNSFNPSGFDKWKLIEKQGTQYRFEKA